MSVTPGGPDQGISLRSRFFRVDWTLRFTHTTVTIDGHPYERPWGEHFFRLEPGRHQLEVSYRYLRRSQAGKASILVDVAPNQVIQASYRAPISVLVAFMPGKLAVDRSDQS
jgi:hypothetical protein